MAFIRWKTTKHGTKQAYLIHSYRDEAGKVRQRTLAYLGREGTLTPEKRLELKAKHLDLSIDWEAIKSVAPPARLDINQLTDAEVLKNLPRLRKEAGLRIDAMVQVLQAAGLPKSADGFVVARRDYRYLERKLTEGGEMKLFKDPIQELVPYLRMVLRSASA